MWIGKGYKRKNVSWQSKGKKIMTTEIFKITSYEAKTARELDSTAQGVSVKFPACVLCRGKKFLVIVYKLDESSPVPDNTFLPQHKCGTIFVSCSRYDWLLTMLGNEDPVYCYLNSNTPHKNCFSLARSLSGSRKDQDYESEKSGLVSHSYRAPTFCISDSYRQQVTTIRDKTFKSYNGGSNEIFNGNLISDNRTPSKLRSYAQWSC
jgi:hypothetical protein